MNNNPNLTQIRQHVRYAPPPRRWYAVPALFILVGAAVAVIGFIYALGEL